MPASVVVGAGCSAVIVSAPSGFDGIESILFRPWGFRLGTSAGSFPLACQDVWPMAGFRQRPLRGTHSSTATTTVVTHPEAGGGVSVRNTNARAGNQRAAQDV